MSEIGEGIIKGMEDALAFAKGEKARLRCSYTRRNQCTAHS